MNVGMLPAAAAEAEHENVGGLDRECMYISDMILALQAIQSARGDLLVECHNEAGDYDNARLVYVRETHYGVFCRVSPCGEDQ